MLSKEAAGRADGFEAEVEVQVSTSLTQLETIKKQHDNLITPKCHENKAFVLALRRQLLSQLAKYGSVRVDTLTQPMRDFKIAEQLCANDVTTFVREIGSDEQGFDVVVPYFPCVVSAFNKLQQQLEGNVSKHLD